MLLNILFTQLAQIDTPDKYGAPFFNSNPKEGIKGVGSLVSVILSNVYILAGVVLLILFLWAGFKMIQSAGTRDAQKAAEAKNTLTYAVIGFLIIFASYWIIQIVEAITGLTIL
ncbi:MAG: Uncharacterized protein G01um10145_969 [Microgenomates group bacterium Gr01-1014_5]|nr:MAG: Uncharacterized protein G01um10145_969 [Microgenomates group bacterium Gr01-1014_5]